MLMVLWGLVNEKKDMKGFEKELVEALPELHKSAYYLTGKTEAEDLVQETLLKACTHKHTFTPGTNLLGWLYVIMRNTFMSAQRTKRKHLNFDHIETHLISQTGQRTYLQFLLKDIKHILASIDAELRKPFMMYVYGWKYVEIAKKLALPMGTVKNRIHLTRKRLQQDLKIAHGVYI